MFLEVASPNAMSQRALMTHPEGLHLSLSELCPVSGAEHGGSPRRRARTLQDGSFGLHVLKKNAPHNDSKKMAES
jgi:hypothetical protein